MHRWAFLMLTPIILLALSACAETSAQPSSPIAVASATPRPSRPTSTPVPPTATPSPTPTSTPTPTHTATPTNTPTPSPTPTPTPNADGEFVHIVQPGESIWSIAETWRVLPSQLLSYNHISAGDVQPGREIRIPMTMLAQPYQGNQGVVLTTPIAPTEEPDRVVLGPMMHDWQKLNNCGPTTTAMFLSYFGIHVTQFDTAAFLKPNPRDRNVSPGEIAAYLRQQGFEVFVGLNGDIALLERLLQAGFPVIVEQWLQYDGGMGHYRVVRGFDRTKQEILFNDSFLGPDIWFTYADFLRDWAYYNNLYIVAYRPEQTDLVRSIIGEDWEPAAMWTRLASDMEARVAQTPDDALAWYGLGEARLRLGDPQGAVEAYEQAIAIGLPFRYLWYRYGYLEALNLVGHYEKVLQVSDEILASMEMSEDIRYQRAVALKALGRIDEARAELEKALEEHPGFGPAAVLLQSLGEE
nr:C39 family peptidase [Ardenticatena sp.]